MRTFLITVIFFIAQSWLFSQQERIDSLISLTQSPVDSLKLIANRELSIEYMRKSTEKAIDYAEKALMLAKKLQNKREEGIALNLAGLGYSYLGNLSLSLDYYHQSLKIREALGDLKLVSASLNNIGTIYVRQGEHNKAIETYLRALKIRQETGDLNGQSQTLNNLGICYQRLGNSEKSLDYHLKGLEIKYKLGDEELIASSLMNIGRLNANINRLDEALDYFGKALTYREKNNDIYGKALTLFNIADVFAKKSEIENALIVVQQALITIVHDFSDSSYLLNPEANKIYPEEITLELLSFKANLLYRFFQTDSTKRNCLELSLETYDQVINLLQTIKTDYSYEKDKLTLLRARGSTFRQAADAALRLYRLTGDPHYIERSFYISEKYKANILFELICSEEAKYYAGIPDSLIEKEKIFKESLSALQYKMHRSKSQPGISPDSLASQENEILEVRMRINNLTEVFRNDYPEYFELLYTDDNVTLTEIQKGLAKDEIILEYFESDESMNIFFVSRNDFGVFSEPADSLVADKISGLRGLLHGNRFSDEKDSLTLTFINLAYPLYRYFLQPVENKIAGKRIIIIPDGLMSSINFEMLITDSLPGENPAFHQLPFFIKNGPVSYSYSASLYFKSLKKSKEKNSGKGLAAFALSFENYDATEYNNDTHSQELTGTTDEVSAIIKITGGNAFFNELASEEAFKLYAPTCRIIHAATHGVIDDENPLYSMLKFYPDTSGTEDGMLHTYEIFGMNLEARIAVLSACNSGYGKFESGEGMMTLARGFLYAGVPTLVISLWNVNDESTSRIMKEFYQNMENGLSSTEALHQAKLKFLENSDNILSNPFFWAGFVQIGPGQFINDRKNLVFWWLSLPFLGLVSGYFVMRRKWKMR